MYTIQQIKEDKSIIKSYKCKDIVPLTCNHCTVTYHKSKSDIIRMASPSRLKNKNDIIHNFCSKICQSDFFNSTVEISCHNCNKQVTKYLSKIKKSKNVFCSQSCAAKHTNKTRIRIKKQKPISVKTKLTKIKPAKIVDDNIVPARFTGIIKLCKKILNLPENHIVTKNNEVMLKQIIHDHLFIDLMSPNDINIKYNLNYKGFGVFISKCLGIKTRNLSEALKNYCHVNGRIISDEKVIYRNKCNFNFDPFQYSFIPNLDLIKNLGMYHPIQNPNGATRDHMVSIEYGWRNSVDPSIISHPANCQILTNIENVTKNDSCCLTLEELILRIEDINNGKTPNLFKFKIKKLPKSEEHKKKLADANKGSRKITNGIITKSIKEGYPIPEGFWYGMAPRKIIEEFPQ